jgi:hypothetical protein
MSKGSKTAHDGSKTAFGGLNEEDKFVRKLKSPKTQYGVKDTFRKDIKGHPYKVDGTGKTDVFADCEDSPLRVSVKKTKDGQFQQVHQTSLDRLIAFIPELLLHKDKLEKLFHLPIDATTNLCVKQSVVKLDEDIYDDLDDLIKIFKDNRRKIVEYVLCGNDDKPNILGVSMYVKSVSKQYIFHKMSDVIEFIMNDGDVCIRPSGTVIQIANCLTLQRKGGDSGRKSANNIQFKFVPSRIANENALTIDL